MGRPLKVAYLGPETSYTHQATCTLYKSSENDLVPVTTIQDVFEAVSTSTVQVGVVPFENSSNGSVLQSLDALADRSGRFSHISIVDEIYLPIHHCLLVSGESVSNEDALAKIKVVASHPQALQQCEGFLNTNLKGVERREVSSTSRAAEMAAQSKGEMAAFASRMAAEKNGLRVWKEGVEDASDNETRFLVLRHTSPDSTTSDTSHEDGDAWRSLLVFTVDHYKPGALVAALGTLSNHGINFTSIYSRPTRVVNWQYNFFIEITGRIGTSEVDGALKELNEKTETCRTFGSWRNRRS